MSGKGAKLTPDGEPSSADPRPRVSTLLRDNGHLFRQAFRRRLKALEVTSGEARTLMYLRASEGVPQARLAEILEVQPIALTRVVDRLEASGWVERRLSESDRRVRLLVLTTEGRRLVRRLHQLSDELVREITARLGDEEVARLGEALEGMNAALRQVR